MNAPFPSSSFYASASLALFYFFILGARTFPLLLCLAHGT